MSSPPSLLPTGGVVMVDTSLWVEALRSGGSKTARATVYDAVETGLAVINGLIRTEVLRGVAARERSRLADLLDAVVTVPFARSTFDHAGQLGHELRGQGLTVPTVDLLIVASTLEQGATLLHRDRHFELAADLTDLRALSVH